MKNVNRFYFVRHGLTDLNAKRLMQFQVDEPLNDEGRLQAIEAGDKLAKLAGKSFYIAHSHLCRAEETAFLIHQQIHKTKSTDPVTITGIQPDVRLREREGGSLDMMCHKEFQKLVKKHIPDHLMEWDNLHLICPMAETSLDMIKRMETAILAGSATAKNLNSELLVVGHLGAMDTFARLILGFQDVTMFENATPYLFEKQGGVWTMTKLN